MSDPSYWREQYRVEADANTAIREFLNIDLENPDATLSVDEVKLAFKKEYDRGYNAGRYMIERRLQRFVKNARELLTAKLPESLEIALKQLVDDLERIR